MAHVQKRKIVYSAYRDMLRNYNDRANEILDSKPACSLTEDRGITDRIDSMISYVLCECVTRTCASDPTCLPERAASAVTYPDARRRFQI